MRVLLLAGLGPYFKNGDYLDGTLFDPDARSGLEETYRRIAGRAIDLADLRWGKNGASTPLLRPPRVLLSHLTAATLEGILNAHNIEHEFFSLEDMWSRQPGPAGPFDVVALSTSFICDRRALATAVTWVRDHHPEARLVLGGQYSNLKYRQILAEDPRLCYIVRGDGEAAFPALLAALSGQGDLESVPNLVGRPEPGAAVVENPFEYVDLDRYPAPRFDGPQEHVPYESMRGCPFACKFCSYPAASPKWRFKSAETIAGDWRAYAATNQTWLIRAMDSTFTVPPSRFRQLLDLLADGPVQWEAYSRTDHITDAELVAKLEAARCRALSFGFESMNNDSLARMDKRTVADDNRRAVDLLADSSVDFRGGFMVGYPGETPEDFADTHAYLVSGFVGRFLLSVFSLVDETMPVWRDADKHRLRVLDPTEPAYAWSHAGMDVETAWSLLTRTLDEARWNNDRGVLMLWQMKYETPLVPEASPQVNRRIEKLIERLGFLGKDFASDPDARAAARFDAIVAELAELGVSLADPDPTPP